jgi:cell wall-associated NlpC family hydrolase
MLVRNLTRMSRRAATILVALAALVVPLVGPVDAMAPAGARPASAAGSIYFPRATPRVNRRAAIVAHSKLGHPYVFGAAGPRAFDCSGLMQYSYARAGRRIPRTAEQQFRAARRISGRRLLPGDFVFYHLYGRRGYVFHVGMYIKPHWTIAAVDPAEGVTWQRIDVRHATYGSFTHR